MHYYIEKRTLDRVPTFDFDREMTRATRRDLEAFLTATSAQLWIEHDIILHESLAKSPAYFD